MTELGQRLPRAVVTSVDEGVGAPGANAEVMLFNKERQLAKVGSELSVIKYVVQVELMSAGMRGFAEELV